MSGVRALLYEAAGISSEAGLSIFLVGGAVRDRVLGRSTRDLDLVVEGDPEPLARELARRRGARVDAFERFRTVRVVLAGGLRVDFARARAESYARPAALPEVRPASLEDDLARRDFTVNAMALRVLPRGFGELRDPFGGMEDLRRRRLRVLHPASFRDDPTRLFRGARYAGRLGLSPEPETAAWLAEAVRGGLPGLLSRERVRQELMRILDERDPGPALRLARRWGLWPSFHSEFRWPSCALEARSALERLGLIALAMPRGRGAELARSLPLERGQARVLEAALGVVEDSAAPKERLPAQAEAIVRSARPGLPAAALKPRLARGGDLQDLGLAPGPEFARWLERAARAQWRGEFSSRAGARAWLKKRL